MEAWGDLMETMWHPTGYSTISVCLMSLVEGTNTPHISAAFSI